MTNYLALISAKGRAPALQAWNGNEASFGLEVPALTHYERDIPLTRMEEKNDYIAPATEGLIDPMPVPSESLPEVKKETEQSKVLTQIRKTAEVTPQEETQRKGLTDPFSIPIEMSVIGLAIVGAIWFQAIR